MVISHSNILNTARTADIYFWKGMVYEASTYISMTMFRKSSFQEKQLLNIFHDFNKLKKTI